MLDRTAFYPTSGGQPFDTGTLGEADGPRRRRSGRRHDRPCRRSRARDELARAWPRRLGPPLRSHAAAHGPAPAVGGIRARSGRQNGELSSRDVGVDDRSRQGAVRRSDRSRRGRGQRRALGGSRSLREVRDGHRGGEAAAAKGSCARRRAPHRRDQGLRPVGLRRHARAPDRRDRRHRHRRVSSGSRADCAWSSSAAAARCARTAA